MACKYDAVLSICCLMVLRQLVQIILGGGRLDLVRRLLRSSLTSCSASGSTVCSLVETQNACGSGTVSLFVGPCRRSIRQTIAGASGYVLLLLFIVVIWLAILTTGFFGLIRLGELVRRTQELSETGDPPLSEGSLFQVNVFIPTARTQSWLS